MKFRTLGNPNNPVVLCIHAMFISGSMFDTIVPYLKDNYYIILPTLDGHEAPKKTTFVSVPAEAEKIIHYLQTEQKTEIAIMLGTSLGGLIAFEIFRQNKLHIANIVMDGAPFIHFSKIRIKIMAMLFKSIAHKSAKLPDKPNILDKLYPNHSIEMKKICGNMSDESINHLANSCYTYELPDEIIISKDQTMTFLYSTNEKAKVCIPTVKRYTNCNLLIKDGFKHCEFLYKEPKQYASMLVSNI